MHNIKIDNGIFWLCLILDNNFSSGPAIFCRVLERSPIFFLPAACCVSNEVNFLQLTDIQFPADMSLHLCYLLFNAFNMSFSSSIAIGWNHFWMWLSMYSRSVWMIFHHNLWPRVPQSELFLSKSGKTNPTRPLSMCGQIIHTHLLLMENHIHTSKLKKLIITTMWVKTFFTSGLIR